uniref:Oxidoreductase molybdopterin binding n=1 Tax=Cyanothece sp. (strain PCC 7425 / ATCC 29141) TaxID=395961 RepID=B8HQK5_CYAP4
MPDSPSPPPSEAPTDQPQATSLSRRRLIQLAQFGGLGALFYGCVPGGLEASLNQVWEPVNQKVEELIFNPQKLATEFPPEAIEPAALLVNDTQTNAGLPTPLIDPSTYHLEVGGEVAQPQSFTLADLQTMASRTMTIRHVCVEGWAAIVQWTGIPLQAIAALVQPQPSVRYVYFFSADGYYESWDLPSALHPQTLLVYGMNGGPLPRAHGAPIRLAAPIKLGYKQSKWVTAIAFTSQLAAKRGYWEDQGYEWYAGL